MKATKKTRLYDFTSGTRALSGQVDEEFNQLVDANNDVIDDLATLAGEGQTTETVKGVSDALTAHKSSTDHDGRYYTETEINALLEAIKGKNWTSGNTLDSITLLLALHKLSGDHDTRYYLKGSLDSYFKGGDTIRRVECFTIVSSNNGDGTFTYSDEKDELIDGNLGENGEQIFTLQKGTYPVDEDRIEIIVNDTLHRSKSSGGLIEPSESAVGLTQAEGNTAEITVIYFERLGIANISIIERGTTRPTSGAYWYEVVS